MSLTPDAKIAAALGRIGASHVPGSLSWAKTERPGLYSDMMDGYRAVVEALREGWPGEDLDLVIADYERSASAIFAAYAAVLSPSPLSD